MNYWGGVPTDAEGEIAVEYKPRSIASSLKQNPGY